MEQRQNFIMTGTRFTPILRECLGRMHREIRIALTPVPAGKSWVFLVGCYNSGTTLLSELLGQHASIAALPTEGQFITDQFVKDYNIGLPRMWVDREDLFILTENDTGPDLVRLKKEWSMRLDTNRPILLEKSPSNVAKMRWLQRHFENAHFIGIVRNGYAVAEGIARKAEPHHLKEGWPIEKCAWQWRRSNEVMQQNIAHIKRFLPVTYEALTNDTSGTLNRITRFLGIPEFVGLESGREWKIHERHEPLRNMNDESIRRLEPSQIESIYRVAGNMLDTLGYSRP
jgi:hypothetical protein